MKKKITIAVVASVSVFIAAYLLWPESQPEPVQEQTPPTPPKTEAPKMEVPKAGSPKAGAIPAASAPQSLEAKAVIPPKATLTSDSDKFVIDALAELVGNKSLMKFFHTDKVITRIVATIDNLPDMRAPMKVMPIERAPGKFITEGEESDLTISTSNAARYAPYVKIAQAIDARKLVGLYVRIYPSLQESYEKLGYPNKYFNDRMLVTIDDLLAAPDITEPVKLVQPNVFFLYADPDLEQRSIGQRIIMRIGSANEAIIKAKLTEIKKELKAHMRGTKLVKSTK